MSAAYDQETRDAILYYLQEEFPGYDIEEQQDKESYCFRVIKDTQTHFVRVMFTLTEDTQAQQLAFQLDQFSVASTMRGLGDFPVVVTESGCMFGSP